MNFSGVVTWLAQEKTRQGDNEQEYTPMINSDCK